jgi:hypothetical protein
MLQPRMHIFLISCQKKIFCGTFELQTISALIVSTNNFKHIFLTVVKILIFRIFLEVFRFFSIKCVIVRLTTTLSKQFLYQKYSNDKRQ